MAISKTVHMSNPEHDILTREEKGHPQSMSLYCVSILFTPL